jgi:hypothetical protein
MPSAASSPHPSSYAPHQDEHFLVRRADIIRNRISPIQTMITTQGDTKKKKKKKKK